MFLAEARTVESRFAYHFRSLDSS